VEGYLCGLDVEFCRVHFNEPYSLQEKLQRIVTIAQATATVASHLLRGSSTKFAAATKLPIAVMQGVTIAMFTHQNGRNTSGYRGIYSYQNQTTNVKKRKYLKL
jgi:hypothetical protein